MEYFNRAAVAAKYPGAEGLMFPPMKIWKVPDSSPRQQARMEGVWTSGQYFLQEKIDGALYSFVRTDNPDHPHYLFSRTVSRKDGLLLDKADNVTHIVRALDCLPPKTIIIGEIYYPGKTSKDTVSVMGSLPDAALAKQVGNPIHYYLHDMIYCDGEDLLNTPAEDRYDKLAELWKTYNLERYPFLRLAEKIEENLEQVTSEILARGGEGVVLKRKCGYYTPDKRPSWETIKIKQTDTVDVVCMGFQEPETAYTGKEPEKWPFWAMKEDPTKVTNTCMYQYQDKWFPVTRYYYLEWYSGIIIGAYNDEGELVKIGVVSSGLSDDVREEVSKNEDKYKGLVCELGCMSVDHKAHTLRHPRFLQFRTDKNPKDCLLSQI